ncbi:hypothetical protein Tco_1108889 [Tanacetum coccineum]
MTTLADKAILSGADNHPPMLEKDMYDSWKSIMELYMMNRQHGRMILESVKNAIQVDCDIKATNIIPQGLPPEVYALVSNHKVAKELWERIQLLIELSSCAGSELGSELTLLAGSELKTSELDTSELKTSEYRFLKIFILASYEQELSTCEQELCPFNFLPASCQVSSSELHPASYRAARLTLHHGNNENGVNILKSIDEGPFQMGTFQETLAEGNEDKERYNADIRATNILLQGLPKDIYSLINHYTDAKDIWDNVKMLLEGLELTKEDHGSQLFVIAVKLNRGLRDSNYDQLYAYLKQHKAHANENKMMLERFTQPNVDPLALMSNVSHQQYNSQSSTNPSSTYVPPHFADNSQLDSGLSPTDNLIENLTNTLAILTQSYKTYLPQTNNQLRTSSNPRNQATVQDGRVVVQNVQGRQNKGQGNNAWGAGAAGYGGAQNRVGNANPRQARQENGVALDEEHLLFIAGGQDNVVDKDVDEQPVEDLALNVDNVFQADDCDAFDSDVDEAPTTQTMFMANLSSADLVYDEAGSSYDSDVLSEYIKDNPVPVVQNNVSSIPNDAYMMILNDMHEPLAQYVSEITQNNVVSKSLTAELATYKEQV